MLWKKLGFTVGILCASIGTSGVASAEDKDFLAAREAYRVSDLVALSEYSTKLQGDIFAVYADYYLLSRQLDKVDPIAVITFLQKYPDTWLAEKLRGEWLLLLAKRQDWTNYRQFYSGLQGPEFLQWFAPS